jgi:hypothetical protein
MYIGARNNNGVAAGFTTKLNQLFYAGKVMDKTKWAARVATFIAG